ncbi:MAG: FAD-dependent oxidoreductase [Solirubrobacterales bacterium]|nr:FAD-dependent oxidoreductase [Solirubrobacterales bacterium]
MEAPRQHRLVDVLVIGGGVVGAAAALALARRSRRVALVEGRSLRRAQGSSAGSARIFAPAAYPDPLYLELGLRALERWREIETQSGRTLLSATGALTHGEFAERELPALRAAGVEAELLSPADALERFGVSVGSDAPLLHQPDAGVIRADHAHGAILGLARAGGAELRQGERVHAIRERDEGGLEVDTARRRWRCSSAIVAAGPWSRELLGIAAIDVPLSASRQSVAYFDLQSPSARPPALMEFDGEEPFALWDPARGLKAAFHARGALVADGERGRPQVDRDAIDRVVDWVRARFPRLAARPHGAEACLYTNAPGERFILERRGRIVVASACNGQGFQFAPETGELVAGLALEALEATEVGT